MEKTSFASKNDPMLVEFWDAQVDQIEVGSFMGRPGVPWDSFRKIFDEILEKPKSPFVEIYLIETCIR